MNVLSKLLSLPLRLIPKTFVMRVLSGELRGAKWVAGSLTQACWLGTYKRESQRLLARNLKSGDVVWDIGANVGFFTLIASRLTGRRGIVYAFEPHPSNLAVLRFHLHINNASNVRVSPLAISLRGGMARLATARNAAIATLSDSGDLDVHTESLDELLSAGRIDAPQFVKIDVAGGEVDVLKGATQSLAKHRPAILLYAHDSAMYQQCWRLLAGLGYACEAMKDHVVFAR